MCVFKRGKEEYTKITETEKQSENFNRWNLNIFDPEEICFCLLMKILFPWLVELK